MSFFAGSANRPRKPFSHQVSEGKNFESPQGSFHGRGLIWISALSLIIFSLVLAWLILGKIKNQAEQDIRVTLDTVLKTTQEALHNWVLIQMTEVTTWSFSPQLIKLAEAQLNLPRYREALLASPALAEMRELLQPPMGKNNFIGFFIISPDFISVASMRDSNVGTANLLTAHKDFLLKVLDGNVLISPILHSDVPLLNSKGELAERQPTMFVAAPIQKNKVTIGILTFRIDPAQHFSRITQLGRVGRTGETYAFDQTGRLISESRFDQDLRKIGLIPFGKRAILNIEIRDPGGNLMEGFQPAVSREQLPLSYMASEAIAKRPGLNLDGYRDYRGVPVAGAWLWNEDMDFGLATEIDYAEAFRAYNTTRWSIMLALSLTVVLSLGLSFNIDMGRRRALKLAKKIQEGQTHLKAILENLVEGIITIDERGIIQSFNPAAEKIFGYRISEVIGQPVNLLMPEPFKSQHDEYLKKYLQTNQPNILGYGREVSGLRKNGTTFPLELALSEMRLSGSRNLIGVFRDITDQKRAQEQLNQLSRAVEQSPASVVITDTQGKIEYVNPKFSQVTGYTLKEIKGKNPQFLKSGFMSRKLYKQLWETICAGEEWQGEFYNKKKNGELFWELASISPIKNEKGIVTHFVAVKEDITRRKKTELELQKEIMFNQFLKDIAIASNEALNLEDAVQVCLDRVCELSGWPVGHLYVVNEDTGELNPTKVWHIDDPIRFATFKKVTEATHFSSGIGLPGRVLSSGKPAWIVDVNKDPNFPRAQLAKDLGVKTGFGFPILTGKNVVAVLEFFSSQVTGHDEDLLDVMGNIGTQLGRVSERKRGEKKLRQSHQELRDLFHRLQTIREEERTFIAREIHDELGQLLTVLKIDTSWIEKKLPKEEKILLNKTRAMITFIDKIIESVKRISSDLRPEELDMLGLTEAIEWQAQEFEERMGIKCDLDLSLCDVSLEPDRSTTIFRILQETLTNVARHANASKVKIKFCEENGDVVLEVKDNGKGISKRKISDPKSLGLLGMKERVRLWEGNIKINGKQGQGTTVTVKIPMN